VENQLADHEIKQLIEFAYAAADKWPLAKPVSKRNGRNSQPINFNNPLLMNILSESLQAVKHVYEPTVEISLEKYWVNINPTGSYNVRHTHPRSVFACTLYLQTPPDSGDLVLYNMNPAQVFSAYSNKQAQYNFTEFRIKPKPGLFVAFPGWLDHSVDINNSDTDRISISMNIVTHE
jgi:uncharacterized protein (TIGR02466 family)